MSRRGGSGRGRGGRGSRSTRGGRGGSSSRPVIGKELQRLLESAPEDMEGFDPRQPRGSVPAALLQTTDDPEPSHQPEDGSADDGGTSRQSAGGPVEDEGPEAEEIYKQDDGPDVRPETAPSSVSVKRGSRKDVIKDDKTPPSRSGSVSSKSSTWSIRRLPIPQGDDGTEDELHLELRSLLETMTTAMRSEDEGFAREVVMALLVSSPFWDETVLSNINYIFAVYLMKTLKLAGCIEEKDKLTPAKEALVEFYRFMTRSDKKDSDEQEKGGTVDVPTGRFDHRGFPITSRQKVPPSPEKAISPKGKIPLRVKKEKAEEEQIGAPFPVKPPAPIPRPAPPPARSTRGFQDSDGPDDSGSSSSSESERRGKRRGDHKRRKDRKKSRRDRRRRKDKDNGDSDGSSSSESEDSRRRGKRGGREGRGYPDGDANVNIVKSIMTHFSKSENRWAGPKDYRFTTEDFIEHFSDFMSLLNAPSWLRLRCLKFTLKSDALDEYNATFSKRVKDGEFRNASNALTALGRSLETSEYKAFIKNQWNTMSLADIRDSGDSTLMAFGKLVRRAQKLQRKLGFEYKADALLCDFYRRALQHESFWAYVDDSSHRISSRKLQGKIELAIEKERNLKRGSRSRNVSEALAAAIDTRRWGQPDSKRLPSKGKTGGKNPKYKDGTTMLCTGCGSGDHFYNDCTNPDKVAYREKRLTEIAKMKRDKQGKFLRSYFMQLEGDDDDESNGEHDGGNQGVSPTLSFNLDNVREISEELEKNLDESMFLDVGEEDENDPAALFTECMNTQTRHVFFGSTMENYSNKRGVGKVSAMKKKGTALNNLRYPNNVFPGIMIDNGSTGSLCGISQLEAYRKFTGNPTPMRKLKGHYAVSGHGGSECIGVATFKFPYGDVVLEFDAPIVKDADFPLILGLRDQDKLGTHGANQKENTISFEDGPPLKIMRDMGHLWLRWNYATECLFTETELKKLHFRFGHPGIRRMHDFLKRVKPSEVDKDTRGMLADIQSRCRECQLLAPKPYVVQVAVPRDDLMFNSEVVLDIMYIQGKSVLHLVDRATHYQAARFLESDTAESVWRTFMEMWVLIYLGAPDNLRHDQGVQFVTPRFQAMAAEAGITCRPVGVESPHAMGVGERYHGPLRTTFLKLQETYGMRSVETEISPAPEVEEAGVRRRGRPRKVTKPAGVSDDYLLAISVMCINSTVGPEGICPTLLVFGAMPKLPLPRDSPGAVPQSERMKIMHTAREEYISIVAKMRLRQAEKAFIPRAPPTSLQFGDKVLVYREKSKRWEPRIFISRDDNTIIVQEPDGEVQPYAIQKVSELKEGVYLPRPDLYGIGSDAEKDAEKVTDIVDDGEGRRQNVDKEIPEIPEFELSDAEIPVQVDPATGEIVPGYESQPRLSHGRDEDLEDLPDITGFDEITYVDVPDGPIASNGNESEDEVDFLFDESMQTVVIGAKDPRRAKFGKAIEDEVKGLFEKGTFEEVKKSSLSKEELKRLTIMKAKLVLAVKDPGTPEEREKARLVVQAIGSKDKDKRMLFTYSPTVTRSSVRVMLAVASGMKIPIYLRDISQAYVSTESKLLREIYVTPPRELNVADDVLWLVRRPLYGLPESGLLWFETYIAHHQDTLNMKSMETDPCLLYRHDKDGKLDGLVCLQVDDSVGAGSENFLQEEAEGSKRFKTHDRKILEENGALKFNGQHVEFMRGHVKLHQHSYVDRMPTEPIPRTPESFASNRGCAAYVTSCTRPDAACAVNQLAQTPAEQAKEAEFKRLDGTFLRLKATKYDLFYGNVDLSTAEIHVFADASFATNKDLSSQLGYVIVLVDEKGACSVLAWSSVKCKRVTRSVLAAELYAVAHAYDAGFALTHAFAVLLSRKVCVRLFTDSRTLFDSIVTLRSMTEKRLLIDIAGLREAYRNGDLGNLGWIRSEYNIADALTKDKKESSLHRVLATATLKTPVEQWIAKGAIPRLE